MIKKISLIALSLVLVQNFLFAAQPLQTKTSELTPDFTLLDLENKEFSLSGIKGKPTILFFWTTTCPYCRKELKQLNDIHAELLKDGVELVSINEDQFPDRVPKFIKNYPLSYRVLLDSDNKVAGAYGILGVPTYNLINKEGQVVFSGWSFPREEYKDLILK